ncbi:sigma-70 family RNA polymerase sigma factor, partial [Streptomyces sp. NPDC005900]
MSSRPETPANATGAHRAHRDSRKRSAPRQASRTAPPARYEPCLDGLFTYCLSVLCDHDAATAALGDVLQLAERRGSRGPGAEGELLRPWLYALARWVCLRRLAEAKRNRQGAHAARGAGAGRRAGRDAAAATRAARSAGSASSGASASPGASAPADASVSRGAGVSADAMATPGSSAARGSSVPLGAGASPVACVAPDASSAPGAPGAPNRSRPATPATPGASGASGGSAQDPAALPEETARRRHRELAQLAWPEAAGTTPEQREALELAVRHQLTPAEVAAVLGMDLAKARGLLASAACEVERTRAALAVVESGSCPIVARLTGDNQLLLGAALRRELVRHVDDCPSCRRTAERAGAGAWPGTAVSPATLPLVAAPRDALPLAMAHVARARGAHPRYDRRGFPMDPKDHAARRDRL